MGGNCASDEALEVLDRPRRGFEGNDSITMSAHKVGTRKPSTRAKWRSFMSARSRVLENCLTVPTLLEIEILRQCPLSLLESISLFPEGDELSEEEQEYPQRHIPAQ